MAEHYDFFYIFISECEQKININCYFFLFFSFHEIINLSEMTASKASEKFERIPFLGSGCVECVIKYASYWELLAANCLRVDEEGKT